MRSFFLFLLTLSANTYAATYCDLLWQIPHFQAQSFKKVNELEYDLVIKTDPNMKLLSRVKENMLSWYYVPVAGWYSYWVEFDNGIFSFPNNIKYQVISINNETSPRTEHPVGTGGHVWTNGCTEIDYGAGLNWGESTNLTLRLKFENPIPAGIYNFSGNSLPVKVIYEENKGGYADSATILRRYLGRLPYISVDNWQLEVKAPTCSHNHPSLDFGQITYEQAKAGINISKNLSLSCKDNPVSVKLYFKDTQKTVTEAFCGKNSTEKNCKITIGNNNKDNIIFNKDSFSSSGSGTLNIPINATFKSKKPEPGPFKDSVIIVAEIN